MATTTNFNWSTPDDTSLVKDGAAAIRTLGSSIDTSFVDLKGGTSGQVLSKASNTDLDFSWVTSAGDIEGVSVTSPITGGGTSGTVTIGIASTAVVPSQTGNAGKYLTTDGSTSSWATVSSGAVVQVKSATYSTATSNTSGTYADTGLSLSITPTSASNKILVIVSQAFYMNRLDEEIGVNFRLMEGASAIHTDTLSNWQYVNTFSASTDWAWNTRHNVTWLAAPATTSATTYKTQFAVGVTGSSAVVTAQQTSRVSTITLMEVTP